MLATQLTLQNRITSLMVISSVIFISAFTFIQVNNQIANINRYNKYQASLSSAILRNNLEMAIKQVDPAEISKSVQTNLLELKDANLIKEIVVFDQEGKIIASTQTFSNEENVSYRDILRWKTVAESTDAGKPFVAEVDRQKHAINLYFAIKPDPQKPIKYIAKSTFFFANAKEALTAVYFPVMIVVLVVILANIIFGYILSNTVLGPIKILNSVTKIIAEGNLNVRTDIHTNDELQELGSTFNYMTEQLIKMKERAENANPLTKLPGNIIIHEEIEKKIKTNQKFVVIYCDLDNFKAFNDKYGIAKGDEAIKLTADVFKEAIKARGSQDDFLGHEGGDDFILITTPEKSQKVADYIISEFDQKVRSLYNAEDLKQGFIIAHARDNSVKQFPIMTISLAGVTNEGRTITSYAEVTNIAAEVKKYVKAIEGSAFVMDKRKDKTRAEGLLGRL